MYIINFKAWKNAINNHFIFQMILPFVYKDNILPHCQNACFSNSVFFEQLSNSLCDFSYGQQYHMFSEWQLEWVRTLGQNVVF